jgi:hypothetical protein
MLLVIAFLARYTMELYLIELVISRCTAYKQV